MPECQKIRRGGLDQHGLEHFCRLNSFVCRNINVWNSLPAHVVESDSVAMFKRRLSRTNILCS